jgi:phospholipid-binding lipoprotein MlaA
LVNSLLQAKGKKSATTTGRFLTNTTIGIGGLFDPATKIGMKLQNEDFGQTLGVWGLSAGNYLVLPVFGPNTVRSTSGLVVDAAMRSAAIYAIGLESAVTIPVQVVEAIDRRHVEKFRYYDNGYPFEYYMVRFLYTQQRDLAVMK